MKKVTLLAAAVASAIVSSAALADNTMYGHMRLRVQSADHLTMQSGKLVIGFKGSEDLGNGLTSLYQLELEHDNAQSEKSGAGAEWHNDKSYVGLKGDFGTALIGNFGDFAGWACGATDIFQINSGATCGVGATNGSLGNSVAYIGGAGDLSYGVGLRLNDGTRAPFTDDTMDTVLAVKYAADAFSVGAQLTDAEDLADPIMVIGGSYKLGEMTIGFTLGDNGNDAATAIALAMPLGGGTFKIGLDTGEDAGVADTTNVMWQKSMSKSTYTGVQFSDVDGATDSQIIGYIGVKF